MSSSSKMAEDIPCVQFVFVCVEVLRPSQPSGVMSSAISLTTLLLGRLRPISCYILSPETDNCPSLISGRQKMTVKNNSVSSPINMSNLLLSFNRFHEDTKYCI